MKKLTIICLVICLILGAKLAYFIYKPEPEFQVQMYDENILARVNGSIKNSSVPQKYKVYKEMQLTHADGTPVVLQIVKFECCDQVGGLVPFDGAKIVLGYLNEVSYKSPLSTTTEMLPEIKLNIVFHELVHLSTLHNTPENACIESRNITWQETVAYDAEHLYTQILSFDEDNWIRLAK